MRGSIGMPSFILSMAVQKKQSAIPPSQGPLSSRTIARQKVGNKSERKEYGFHEKSVLQTKKTTCSVNKSVQICNSVSRVAAVTNGLNVDERLKAARERREEQQKLIVSKEHSRLEREQRARQYYEQQLQERKKKLQQQRLREERRRLAVEEKRKQRLREEKERYESAVRRTLEKSLKAQQHLNQNPRGRKPTKYAPRRLPLTTWEKNLVNRLLTPTCSYLARSRSAGCLSGGEVSYHSMNISTPKTQQHPSSLIQQRVSSSLPSSRNSHLRSTSVNQIKAVKQQNTFQRNSDKKSTSVNSRVKTGAATLNKNISSSPERSPQRAVRKQSTPLAPELPSVPEEDLSVCASLSPGNTRPVRRLDRGDPTQSFCSNLPEKLAKRESFFRTAGDGSPSKVHPQPAPQPPEIFHRPSAGTSDPEEASRLLAERRREARLQREKEEQERLQREKNERSIKDELERRRAEERARMEAEAQRLIEQKKAREEEEQRLAEEERAQAMREAALLQKQREEELAKERARSEQIKQEREIVAQKEEAARQARKKRLEEIMRRTRRTDSPDMKIIPNEGRPKENAVPTHNGTMDDVVKLSVASKPTQLGLKNEDDVVPVVAFKERKSLRTLSGLDEIQTHQRAEVI